jgi:hypothetical protein
MRRYAAAEDRRITWTIALSVALHAGLLLFGLAHLPTSDFGTVPELRVFIEDEEGPDSEHEDAPAAEQPAALAKNLNEQLVQPTVANPTPQAEPPLAAASSPPPAPSENVEEATSAETFTAASDSSSSDSEPAVVARVDDSASDAALTAQTPEPELPEIEIPTVERSMLARRVLETTKGFHDSDLAQLQLSWEHEGQQYTAVVHRQPAADHMGIERVMVEISTEEEGRQLRTRVQMKRLAFSHFTQLVDYWDREVQLHDDVIAGRFHSNSEIFVGYDRKVAPQFLGKVTTAAHGFTVGMSMGRKRREDIFRGGLETRAGRIALPDKFLPFGNTQSAGNSDVRQLAGDTRLIFYPDGTCGVQSLESGSPEERQTIGPAPVYFVADRKAKVHMRGVVRGTVLVYSPDRIVVEGDLTYSRDPREVADADDYLGLVSDRFVEIAPPEVTGPGDIEIHAAIYAKRRFIVTDIEHRKSATLYIYGSLTAGSLTATEPRYATKIEFDGRFEHYRPPGFPVTNRYEIEAWDSQWTQMGDEEPAEVSAANSSQ